MPFSIIKLEMSLKTFTTELGIYFTNIFPPNKYVNTIDTHVKIIYAKYLILIDIEYINNENEAIEVVKILIHNIMKLGVLLILLNLSLSRESKMVPMKIPINA